MMRWIGLWAFAGSAVATCWVFIAATVGPHYSDLNRSAALTITIPLSWIGRRYAIPMTYYQSILMNSATYALLGLGFEPFLRRHRKLLP